MIMNLLGSSFLVFAGGLICYFLTHRDRSSEEAARLAAERESEELRGQVATLSELRTSLDQRCSRQKGQLNLLQQLCDDWSAGREELDRERARLEVDLKQRKETATRVSAELELEKQKRIAAEDEVHHKGQEQLEQVSLLAQEWRGKNNQLESMLVQHQTDLKSQQNENESLAQRLHESESRVAELQSQITSSEQLLETASKNASGLKQEYVSLETSLRESHQLVAGARSECAAAVSGRDVAQEALRSLKIQHDQLQQDNQSLRNEVASLESVVEQAKSLKQSIENVKSELSRFTEQRDAAIAAETSIRTMATGLQARIDNQEATIHGLRESRAEAMSQLKRENDARSQAENRLADLDSKFKQKTHRLQEHAQQEVAAKDQQRVTLEEKLAKYTGAIQQLTTQRDQQKSELDQTRQKIAEVTRALAEREQSVVVLEAEVEELSTLQVRVRELESLLQRREAEMQQLNVTSDEAELLRDQFSNLQDQYAIARRRQVELETSLQELQEERQQDQSAGEEHQSELSQLQSRLSASADTIRNLRRERAAVLARLANYRTIVEPERAVISFTQAMELQRQQSETFDPEYGGQTSRHAKRGLIYTSEPDNRDDLKRISGIAEVLEGRLNDYGIYTFKQVMEWTVSEIAEFSNLLTFRDRIERDDWQGQARFFYHEKLSQQKVAA